MTNPTPEALAFRAKIDAEGPDWPDELKEAATLLRCELDVVPYQHWKDSGGPARLEKYATLFARLYVEWQKKG